MEKQAYALVKSLKEFITYILHSHIIAYVPNNSFKDILTQPDPKGRRGKWITFMLEYDLEIKPIKLITGQSLSKLMVQENCDIMGINFIVICQRILRNKKLCKCLRSSLIHLGIWASFMC